jgi:hypothetical protein
MYCRHQGCKIHSRLPPHAGDLPRYYTNTEQSRPGVWWRWNSQPDMSMVPWSGVGHQGPCLAALPPALTAHKQEARGASSWCWYWRWRRQCGDGDNDHDLKTTTTLLNSGLSLRSVIYFTVLTNTFLELYVRAKCIYQRILALHARPLCSRILTKWGTWLQLIWMAPSTDVSSLSTDFLAGF